MQSNGYTMSSGEGDEPVASSFCLQPRPTTWCGSAQPSATTCVLHCNSMAESDIDRLSRVIEESVGMSSRHGAKSARSWGQSLCPSRYSKALVSQPTSPVAAEASACQELGHAVTH
jgi:hypothetical protein